MLCYQKSKKSEFGSIEFEFASEKGTDKVKNMLPKAAKIAIW